MKHFRILSPDLAIDMGTANTRTVSAKSQTILQEPTVLALDINKKQVISIGEKAKEVLGKSPESIMAVRPLREGVISDFELTQALLEYYIHQTNPGLSLFPPRIGLTIPSGATDVEERALQDAALQSGAKDVILVEETLAAAYGAKLIQKPAQSRMIANLGAGTSEAAIVSGYGLISSKVLFHGGDDVDQEIKKVLQDAFNLDIGDNTAESLKNSIASLSSGQQMEIMEIGGRDALSGLPKTMVIRAGDLLPALEPYIFAFVDALHSVLEKAPPEVASDIMNQGLFLTGGLSQLKGLDIYLRKELSMPVVLSDQPMFDSIRGALAAMSLVDTIGKREGE